MSQAPSGLLTVLLRAIRVVLGGLIFTAVALNFANVVGRYVFFRPIMWAEEILVFIMVWCVLLGAVLVTWEGRHLRVDVLHLLAPPPVRRALELLTLLVFLAAAGFVLVQSSVVLRLLGRTGQRSVVAELPMTLPYSAIPISFALIVVFLALRLRDVLRGRRGGEPEGPAGPPPPRS